MSGQPAYDEDAWCIDCGEDFRYDDCGGYNPPCACGLHCRSCHEAAMRDDDEDDRCDDCGRYWDDCECDDEPEPLPPDPRQLDLQIPSVSPSENRNDG